MRGGHAELATALKVTGLAETKSESEDLPARMLWAGAELHKKLL